MDLEAFELVLLRRPGNAPDYDEAELERIQRSTWRITPGCATPVTS